MMGPKMVVRSGFLTGHLSDARLENWKELHLVAVSGPKWVRVWDVVRVMTWALLDLLKGRKKESSSEKALVKWLDPRLETASEIHLDILSVSGLAHS